MVKSFHVIPWTVVPTGFLALGGCGSEPLDKKDGETPVVIIDDGSSNNGTSTNNGISTNNGTSTNNGETNQATTTVRRIRPHREY